MHTALFAAGCSYYNAELTARNPSKTNRIVSKVQSDSVELNNYYVYMLAREGDEQCCICLNA